MISPLGLGNIDTVIMHVRLSTLIHNNTSKTNEINIKYEVDLISVAFTTDWSECTSSIIECMDSLNLGYSANGSGIKHISIGRTIPVCTLEVLWLDSEGMLKVNIPTTVVILFGSKQQRVQCNMCSLQSLNVWQFDTTLM